MSQQLVWLLDDRSEEAGLSDLRAAIEAIGDRYTILSRKELRLGSWDQALTLRSVPTLAYGSIEFVKALGNDFYPGKWCDWTELRCERYFARVGELLLNEDYLLLPSAEVRRRQKALLQQWNPMFLRPSRADKVFSGFVAHTSEEIERQLEKVEAYDLVVLASSKVIEAEYRMVAVRGKGVVAASQYMQDGQSSLQQGAPKEAYQMAATVIERIGIDFPDPLYLVDLARHQGGYRLLEINGFSYSLFYECDLIALVTAAHDEALAEWQAMQL